MWLAGWVIFVCSSHESFTKGKLSSIESMKSTTEGKENPCYEISTS